MDGCFDFVVLVSFVKVVSSIFAEEYSKQVYREQGRLFYCVRNGLVEPLRRSTQGRINQSINQYMMPNSFG